VNGTARLTLHDEWDGRRVELVALRDPERDRRRAELLVEWIRVAGPVDDLEVWIRRLRRTQLDQMDSITAGRCTGIGRSGQRDNRDNAQRGHKDRRDRATTRKPLAPH